MAHCNICGETSDKVEEGTVRSNVRKFGQTQFRIWRCPKCLSIHATDEADLAAAYRDYPYHRVGKQDVTRVLIDSGYRNLLRRLRKAGMKPDHTLLDFGCGGGEFIRYLRGKGYKAEGYDEFSEHFSDRKVLDRQYDVVLSQDVIEHVAEPWEHVRTLSGLIAPGGLLAIGTPNADIVDMRDPGKFFHMLHQPYHRHILSKGALLTIGERFNWKLMGFYKTMYAQTMMPFMNGRFYQFYTRTGDETIDYVLEPLRLNLWQMYTPMAIFWAFFGYFFSVDDNVMAIYRTNESAALPRGA